MRFLDNLGKSLSTGAERVKFEADKFQRTSRISGEISNLRSQVETNLRQLGERALELYQQGSLTAPEIASLAQIIAQLRDQQTAKEQELEQANAETFEQYSANQGQAVPSGSEQSMPTMSSGQTIPVSREESGGSFPTPTSSTSGAYPTPSTDISGTGLPNSASVGGPDAVGTTPYACANCGTSIPEGAAFCPNCGTRVPGQ